MVKPYLVQASKYTYVKVKSDGKPSSYPIKILPQVYVVEYGKGRNRRVFFSLRAARKFIKNNWRKL